MTRDIDDYPPDHREAMARLYKDVLESPVTRVVGDFLFRAQLLLRITDDDPLAVREVIHQAGGREAASREYQALTDAERNAMGRDVAGDWAACIHHAIGSLWHACGVLEVDPAALDADHVALHAATLLSGEPGPFASDTRLDDAV